VSDIMGNGQFFINGIDGESGSYLVPPMSAESIARLVRPPADPEQSSWLKRIRSLFSRPFLGLPLDVDPCDVSRAGWGVVASSQASSDVLDALEPLLAHRRGHVSADRCKVLEYHPGEGMKDWLKRHGVYAGSVAPAKIPYYLLLIGGPEEIPFEFQYMLDIEYAVGRLAFDQVDQYAQYARSVVDYEQAKRLALALLLALLPGAALAELPDLGGREITVVAENAYPPLQFTPPQGGAPTGWEYDAVDEIAKRLNLSVTYASASWDAMIPAVSEGQYDIGMDGITIRDDRRQAVDFSDPYLRSEMFMLVRADETRFHDQASFIATDDTLIGAQPGTTPFYVSVYDLLDGNEQNPRMRLFETFGASVQALKAGDVDLVLTEIDRTAHEGYDRPTSITFRRPVPPEGPT